ncbi:MAG: azurin [Verrucomicrobiota bacterium]
MKTLLITIATIAATALGAFAAEAVTLELTGNDQMQFDKKELTVTEGQKVTLKFKHIGKLPKAAMGHNVVILKPGTNVPAFAGEAVKAGAANDYLPQDDKSKGMIVASTKMLGGGEETSITFTAPAAGEYPYLCTFVGHFAVMQGKLTVKAK